MSRPSLAEFLGQDFDRLGQAVLARCAPLDGKRMYVSGATGFFGKSLLALFAYLHTQGLRFEVTALSRDPDGFLAAEPWVRHLRWLDLRRGDVRAPWPASGRYELLLHAATDTHASAHVDLQAVFDDMLAGTRHALAFAAAHGVQRLLLTGSGAQYGHITDDVPTGIDEASARACDCGQPASAYGEAKRVAELLAALHARRHGTAVVHTRCFAFVGPGLALDGHFAIGNFLRNALAGEPIRLHSSGQALRSYLYSADLALWLLLLLLEAPGGTQVNVGSGQAIRIVDLARQVAAVVQPELAVLPGIDVAGEARPVYVPAVHRAQALGLAAWTPLDLAIERTARWHRQGAA